MKLRAKAIQGAKWSSIQQLLGQLIDFAVFVVIARVLGPEDFGLVALAAVVIAFITPIVPHGLGQALVQRDSIDESHLSSAFWANLWLGIFMVGFVWLSAPFWADIFSQPILAPVLVWLSLSFVFVALRTVQEAIVRRELRFKNLALRTLVAKVLSGIVGIVMVLNDFGVWSLVARQLLYTAINMLLLWSISHWRPKLSFSLSHYQELYPFGLKILGNEMLFFVNRRSANLFIGYFLGAATLGFYNMANRFMLMMFKVVSNAVQQVGVPAFAKIQHEPERIRRAFYELIEVIGLISIPAFIGFILIVPELVEVLLGEKWLPAIPVFQVLMLIGIAQSLLSPLVTILVAIGQPGLRLKLQMIDGIANLVALLIAAQWGIVEVAVAYVLVGYGMVPLWYGALKRFIPVTAREIAALLRPSVVSCLIMAASIFAVGSLIHSSIDNSLFLLIEILVGMVVYAGVVIVFFRNTADKIIVMGKQLVLGRGE